MRLTLGILAWNSAQYIEKLLRSARDFADEIVVGVDSSTTDTTEDICRAFADKLFRLEPIGTSERALAWLNEECSGDWILRLDHDELPSVGLVQAIQGLMNDREVTHYWIPRRWVYGTNEAKWIADPPWWPDWQLRLFRNIRSLVSYPGYLHSDYTVLGAAGYFSEGSIYHYDLVYHSEQRRREKLAQYERIASGNSMPHFYFPDDATIHLRSVPIDDLPWEPSLQPCDQRNSVASVAVTPPAKLTTESNPVAYVSLADMRRISRQECDYPPSLFQASLECIDCPQVMAEQSTVPIQLLLCNGSELVWSAPGLGVPEVSVAYHWLRDTGEIYYYEGLRNNLPRSLRPGQSAKLIAQVIAPGEPGDYILHWDLVIENVSWFSTRGWQGPTLRVRVVNDGRNGTDDALGRNYLRLSQQIPGWIRGNEAKYVLDVSRSLPKDAVIVEIGAFLGSSTVLLAGGRKLAGSGKVHSIDPFDCSGDAFSAPVYEGILATEGGGSLRDRFVENIRRAGLEDNVEVHQGGAVDVAEGWSEPIDLLFLDGDQSRKGARLAYESWSRFLKSGGTIAIHNTEPRVYADDHDGNRVIALEEIRPPRYAEIRLVGATTFARKTDQFSVGSSS